MNNHLNHLDNVKFGDRLRTLREKKNLTMGEMAIATGIPKSSLSYYETGKAIPSLDKTYEIAEYFGVSLDYITGRNEYAQEGISNVSDIAYLVLRLFEYECISMDINEDGQPVLTFTNDELLHFFKKKYNYLWKALGDDDYSNLVRDSIRLAMRDLEQIPATKKVILKDADN